MVEEEISTLPFNNAVSNKGLLWYALTLNSVPNTWIAYFSVCTVKGRFLSWCTEKYPSPLSSTFRLFVPNLLGNFNVERELSQTCVPSAKVNSARWPVGTWMVCICISSTFCSTNCLVTKIPIKKIAAIFSVSIAIRRIVGMNFLWSVFCSVSVCQSEISYNLRKARNSRMLSGLSSSHDTTFSLSSSETLPLMYRCSNCSMNVC